MPDKPKKTVTWTDIENSARNAAVNTGETDPEKLQYFKNKILNHLDNLQAEEDKKVIPFPKKKTNGEKNLSH